jgi:hypothetical protein
LSILIACEESQRVCIEFRKLGFEAYSCDLLPPSGGHPEWHLQQDVLPLLEKPWDLIIAFPPCTYLCSSGMHWTTRGLRDPQLTIDAIEFVTKIWQTDCKYIAIENPIGILSKKNKKTRSNYSALAVWTRRNKSDLPMVEELALVTTDKYC